MKIDKIMDVKDIHDAIGRGMRLVMPKGKTTGAKLVDNYTNTIILVDDTVVQAIIPNLHKLDKYRVDQRLGWSEMGFTDDNFDYYCHVQ